MIEEKFQSIVNLHKGGNWQLSIMPIMHKR